MRPKSWGEEFGKDFTTPGIFGPRMSDFLRDYLNVVWFAAAALAIGGLLLGLAAAIRPTFPSAEKYIAYESGVDPVGMGWSQSQIRYYVFALLFVIFDVEAVFLFPWAASLERYGTFGLVVMLDLHRVAARRLVLRMEAWAAAMGVTGAVMTKTVMTGLTIRNGVR